MENNILSASNDVVKNILHLIPGRPFVFIGMEKNINRAHLYLVNHIHIKKMGDNGIPESLILRLSDGRFVNIAYDAFKKMQCGPVNYAAFA